MWDQPFPLHTGFGDGILSQELQSKPEHQESTEKWFSAAEQGVDVCTGEVEAGITNSRARGLCRETLT